MKGSSLIDPCAGQAGEPDEPRRDWLQRLAVDHRPSLRTPWNASGRDVVCDGHAALVFEGATWPARDDAPPIDQVLPTQWSRAELVTTLGRLRAWARAALEHTEPCEECGGRGRWVCDRCDGVGQRDCECRCGELVHTTRCAECHGVGKEEPCTDCGGSGQRAERIAPGKLLDRHLNRVLLARWLPDELGDDGLEVRVRTDADPFGGYEIASTAAPSWRVIVMMLRWDGGHAEISDFADAAGAP